MRQWVNSSPPRTKLPPFRRRHFQMHFREWKVLYIDQHFPEVCSYGVNWQQPSIGLDNGLAANRRHAISWANADPVRRRIYATLGGDELKSIASPVSNGNSMGILIPDLLLIWSVLLWIPTVKFAKGKWFIWINHLYNSHLVFVYYMSY